MQQLPSLESYIAPLLLIFLFLLFLIIEVQELNISRILCFITLSNLETTLYGTQYLFIPSICLVVIYFITVELDHQGVGDLVFNKIPLLEKIKISSEIKRKVPVLLSIMSEQKEYTTTRYKINPPLKVRYENDIRITYIYWVVGLCFFGLIAILKLD